MPKKPGLKNAIAWLLIQLNWIWVKILHQLSIKKFWPILETFWSSSKYAYKFKTILFLVNVSGPVVFGPNSFSELLSIIQHNLEQFWAVLNCFEINRCLKYVNIFGQIALFGTTILKEKWWTAKTH